MCRLIYNQRDADRRYGLRSSAATGCGWVATYNALLLLGRDTDLEALVRYFQWQVPGISGNFGTPFFGPALCFSKWGFPVKAVADRKKFDAEAAEADVCILFYRWRQGLRLGAHFVALHKTDMGFVGYNTFKNSTGPDFYGPSLDGFLKRHGYFGCLLWTIKVK